MVCWRCSKKSDLFAKMQQTLECKWYCRGFQISKANNLCNRQTQMEAQVPPELKSEFRQGDGVQGMRVEETMDKRMAIGGGFKYFWKFHPGFFGEMIQFDGYIFQMGWFKPPTRWWFNLNQNFSSRNFLKMDRQCFRWRILSWRWANHPQGREVGMSAEMLLAGGRNQRKEQEQAPGQGRQICFTIWRCNSFLQVYLGNKMIRWFICCKVKRIFSSEIIIRKSNCVSGSHVLGQGQVYAWLRFETLWLWEQKEAVNRILSGNLI